MLLPEPDEAWHGSIGLMPIGRAGTRPHTKEVQARRRKPMARWFVDRLPERGIPAVSLRRVLPEAQFVGCMDWEVSGCCDDYRRLDPGQLYVAVSETTPGRHGYQFVQQALERGAAGVVVEQYCPEAGRLQIVVPDARAAHARICQALAGDPSQQLNILGVTGTHGRTITAAIVRSILEAAGEQFGHIGSSSLGDESCDTPGQLAALLTEMVDRGCAGAVVEVSSLALATRRLEGMAFKAALATDIAGTGSSACNTLVSQRRAMAKLFRQLVPGGLAVVNADDANAEFLGGVNLDSRRVAFAFEPVARTSAVVDVSAQLKWLDGSGTRMLLHGFDREIAVHVPLVGLRAASSALAAAAVAWGLGIDPSAVAGGLESVRPVPGRLEAVSRGQDFDVRIDAAQTPTALSEALTALRSIVSGRIHCVLSSDGGGDRAERRELAGVAEMGADRVILTLGNPRTEDPGQILSDLLAGFRQPGRVHVDLDRRAAIETALAGARCGDSVLISGKGRQSVQILGDRVIPCDDHAIASQWLCNRRAVLVSRSA
jgi:UDP-N-acetylmuramoyl-L-alanyl-D-glutamate--2,6-diaminopimelate ligase